MFERLRRGGVALVTALAVAGVGFAPPALADEAYDPESANLTKVIVGPMGTAASQDTYTFTFAGAGTVTKDGDGLVCDGVAQDAATLMAGDKVPEIGTNGTVTLTGRDLSATNTIGPDDSIRQNVVSKPISEILEGATFAHAGVYTYRVTEEAGVSNVEGAFINGSKASYLLRVYVINDNTATSGTKVGKVTVERELDEDGQTDGTKVNPTQPASDETGKITTPGQSEDEVAGDSRGRNVEGFTFANEYATGGLLVVKKVVGGDYANKNQEFPVVLTITDPAAADAPGCCLTYQIMGGTDQTENLNTEGFHTQIDGVPSSGDYMVTFNESNQAIIKADLKDGGKITVTGLFGSRNDVPDDQGNYRIQFTEGLKNGTTFEVKETDSGTYKPTGFVDGKVTGSVDPTITKSGTTYTVTAPGLDKTAGSGTSLTVSGKAASNGTTVYVVNVLEDSNANPTGIIIDNMPYILMVGVPVAVFVGMFVLKRRGIAA